MKILIKIIALSFILFSCNLGETPQQPENLTAEFQAIPNEKSGMSLPFDNNNLDTRVEAKSIGTGPYSRVGISSSSNFNYAKMTMTLPKIDPESLLADAKRYCKIKKINSTISDIISKKISRQIPYIYTGFTGLDIGILYNLSVIDQNCAQVPFDDLPDFPKKWIIFSNSLDGNKGISEFSANSETKIDLEMWFQSLTAQNGKKETYFAISIKKYKSITDSAPDPGSVAVQARLSSSANVNKIVGNLKRVISLAQVEGFQRLYGKSLFDAKISSINVGSLNSSYGKNQWHLLVPPSPALLDPSPTKAYPTQSENYGTGIRPVPSNSLPTSSNVTGLISVVQNDPENFSQKAGVTTSTNALSATIKLLPESAIDGLVSPFKMISPLQSNGVYPVTNYSVGNSGRAALNFKIGNVPAWIVTDPTQIGKIPAGGANAVKFQVKSGANGCPKAPFAALPRPLYRLFKLQDTTVLPTSTNDPAMASNQTVFSEPIDAILNGNGVASGNFDRTATFHTLAVCATAELANFDTSAIAWTPGAGSAEKTLTFKNGGGPQKSELEAIKKFAGSTENAFTPAEITQIKGWTDLDYELTVTTIGANPGGSTLTATVNGLTMGLLAAKDTATVKLTAICKGAGKPQFQIKLNAKNEPDPDMRVKTVNVTLTCIQKPKASIAPNPINITAPIGSTASGSFTLENTGEVDSTLDYIVYRPGQTAGVQVAASNPISTRALPPGSGFPGPIGSVDTRFTSPSETTGSLLKTSATTAASTTIPVSATCSTVGSFSSVIEVTYATGDLTATGTPVFASSGVTVNVTCTGAIYSGDQGGSTINLTAKVGETVNSSAINYSNTGIGSSSDPAILTTSITTNAVWLTVTPSSSSVAPGSGSSFVITTSCVGLAAGTYSGVVTLTTNTGKTFSWTVNLTCVGEPKISVSPNALSFSAPLYASSPPKTLTIQNIGDLPLTGSVSTQQTWLSVSPSSFSTSPSSSTPVQIIANCGSIVETRTGTFTITSNDLANPQIIVNVSVDCLGVIRKVRFAEMYWSTPFGGFTDSNCPNDAGFNKAGWVLGVDVVDFVSVSGIAQLIVAAEGVEEQPYSFCKSTGIGFDVTIENALAKGRARLPELFSIWKQHLKSTVTVVGEPRVDDYANRPGFFASGGNPTSTVIGDALIFTVDVLIPAP
jgi:Viral BACON domain